MCRSPSECNGGRANEAAAPGGFWLVVLAPEVRTLSAAATLFPGSGALFLLGGKATLFTAADPAMSVQALEHELRGGCPYRIGFVVGEPQRFGLFHQTLNAAQLLHHGGRIDILIELQGAAQVKP